LSVAEGNKGDEEWDLIDEFKIYNGHFPYVKKESASESE
jgi:hypothetical protein